MLVRRGIVSPADAGGRRRLPVPGLFAEDGGGTFRRIICVIAGLDPAIQLSSKKMDTRVI